MIRHFRETDIRQVMNLWLNGNIEAHPFVETEYWVSNYDTVQEQILQAEVFVCEEEGKIQGFIGLMGDYIAGLFVDKTYRSMGIGKDLMEYVKSFYSTLFLKVYQQNTRAVAFYFREGFSVGERGIEEETGISELTMIWKK